MTSRAQIDEPTKDVLYPGDPCLMICTARDDDVDALPTFTTVPGHILLDSSEAGNTLQAHIAKTLATETRTFIRVDNIAALLIFICMCIVMNELSSIAIISSKLLTMSRVGNGVVLWVIEMLCSRMMKVVSCDEPVYDRTSAVTGCRDVWLLSGGLVCGVLMSLLWYNTIRDDTLMSSLRCDVSTMWCNLITVSICLEVVNCVLMCEVRAGFDVLDRPI